MSNIGGTLGGRTRDTESRYNVAAAPSAPPTTEEAGNLEGNIPSVIDEMNRFTLPEWLRGMRPYQWAPGGTRSKNDCGSPCCLFYPLNFCSNKDGGSRDIINGFCRFHLKIIFNITYTVDRSFEADENTGQLTIFKRLGCYVADPCRVSNQYTAVFPLFELFQTAPEPQEIKMYHLNKVLLGYTSDSQRVYNAHINFLHTLVTLGVPGNRAQFGNDITTINNHWTEWNKYNSQYLLSNPSNHTLIYTEDGQTAIGFDISGFTTITQMILRLFTVPYVGFQSKNFFSVPSNYNCNILKHITYTNNLCSSGTIYWDNRSIVGNMATMCMTHIKPDVQSKYIYMVGQNCPKTFCIDTILKKDAPVLNKVQIVVNNA